MAGDSTMRATDIGRAARNDLQFRVPRKPVVRLGVRVRPDDDAWVIEGTRKGQVLRGAFAREHVGPLLEACDGTRTLDRIGEITGIGEDTAFEAVSLLWTGGIVEEGDTPPLDGPEPSPELACLLSRLGDSTGVNDSWQDAARRLAAARVVVVGTGSDRAPAADLVEALTPTLSARVDDEPGDGDTLVVLLQVGGAADDAENPDDAEALDGPDGPDSPGSLSRAARRAWELGLPLLRIRAEHEAVTLGPYVDPAFSPCPSCAVAGEAALGPAPRPGRRDMVTGLAARAVAALIARATVTHLPGDARRIDLETFTHTDRPVVSRPGCPVCSAAGGPSAPTAPVGARYEQSVAIPPAAFVDSKGHQQHYKPSNLRLQREFRDWPVCPHTPLPPADLAALARPWPTGAADGDPAGDAANGVRPTPGELATILALSAGVREPLTGGPDGAGPDDASLAAKLRRWTAAGGNIGSVTAYVVVPEAPDSDSGGRVPGTYVYVERDHALALVGPAPAPPDGAGSAGSVGNDTNAADAPAPVRLVLTGNVDKVARKYFSFALRIALQDCGCAFEVVRLVARALGVSLKARARWDEKELAALLGTDPAREPVCAVVDLGGSRAL